VFHSGKLIVSILSLCKAHYFSLHCVRNPVLTFVNSLWVRSCSAIPRFHCITTNSASFEIILWFVGYLPTDKSPQDLPSPPIMVTFKIHLKEPGKRFASGDKVRGKVVFSSRSDQSVISVRVWFKGIAEPSIDHDNLTGNHHILFQHHCEVYSGDSVLLANTYE
jgi:hypothetical protein